MGAVNQTISTILPWSLVGRGRRPPTFSDAVARDAGLDIGDLKGVMLDCAVWRKIVGVFDRGSPKVK